MSHELLSVSYIVLCLALRAENYLLKATVIVSVELAHGHSASGFNPLASKAFRKESQADKDPVKKRMKIAILNSDS